MGLFLNRVSTPFVIGRIKWVHNNFVMFYFSSCIPNFVCYFQRGIWVVGYNVHVNSIKSWLIDLIVEAVFRTLDFNIIYRYVYLLF